VTTIAQPLKGCPQALIAREFGVSQPLITADLKAIRKEWMKSGIRNFDEALNKELKKLDILEREAWAAWTLFMQPTITTPRHPTAWQNTSREDDPREDGRPSISANSNESDRNAMQASGIGRGGQRSQSAS
jgi:hypothetical protein